MAEAEILKGETAPCPNGGCLEVILPEVRISSGGFVQKMKMEQSEAVRQFVFRGLSLLSERDVFRYEIAVFQGVYDVGQVASTFKARHFRDFPS